ncbi:MAG: prolipoprotein diacylglyceryl transferase [bacterium]|nr:MAG: prolipoprotein diacylglyceryl transferase [bacterium]
MAVTGPGGAVWVHDLDPVLAKVGSLELRWYGLFFALAMVQGAVLWIWQVRRSGRSWEDAVPYLWMGIIGVVVGGRLGNILFYNGDRLLAGLPSVLANWRGGFSSHGSTLGILAALYIYGRRHAMPYIEALDRFSLSIPLATVCVRLGNFINGEIVGRAAAVPWAVIYPAYDRARGLPLTPRHPSQLYEAAMGLMVFAILFAVDWKLKERRPRGLMFGLILGCYFTGRFLVEFFKEPHVLDPSFPLTMGQILSVPFALTGWWFVVTRIRNRKAPDA